MREMTWRERQVAAEKTGVWTREDCLQWMDMSTCPAAEAAERCGLVLNDSEPIPESWQALWTLGDKMGWIKDGEVIDLASPRLFGQYLDRLDDLAIQLKREHSA